MWTSSGQYPIDTPPNEESGPLSNNTPLTNGIVFSVCCAKNLSLLSCITERMAKKDARTLRENWIVAKSKPMVMNLTSSVATSSSSVDSPIALRSWGYSELQVDRLDYQRNLVQAQIKGPIPT